MQETLTDYCPSCGALMDKSNNAKTAIGAKTEARTGYGVCLIAHGRMFEKN